MKKKIRTNYLGFFKDINDISNPEVKIPRSKRRGYLAYLEDQLTKSNKNMAFHIWCVKKNRRLYIHLADVYKKVHPHDYKNVYPKADEFFSRLFILKCFRKRYWGERIETFSSLGSFLNIIMERPNYAKKQLYKVLYGSIVSGKNNVLDRCFDFIDTTKLSLRELEHIRFKVNREIKRALNVLSNQYFDREDDRKQHDDLIESQKTFNSIIDLLMMSKKEEETN